MSVIPSQLDVEEAGIAKMLGDLHTCVPAEVVAVRSDAKDKRQFVDVLPMLQRSVIDADGEPLDEPLPVLQMVPVGFVRGGGFFLSLPMRIGDVVLVVFAERSLDTWIENAIPGAHTPVVPGDLSTHSLQGAIALPLGPAPRATLLEGVSGTDLVLGLADGTVLARFTPAGLVSFAEGADYVALADLVKSELTKLWNALNTHTHPVSGSVAGKPTTPLGSAGDVAASKTKAT